MSRTWGKDKADESAELWETYKTTHTFPTPEQARMMLTWRAGEFYSDHLQLLLPEDPLPSPTEAGFDDKDLKLIERLITSLTHPNQSIH